MRSDHQLLDESDPVRRGAAPFVPGGAERLHMKVGQEQRVQRIGQEILSRNGQLALPAAMRPFGMAIADPLHLELRNRGPADDVVAP